jgi:hypothetical protein
LTKTVRKASEVNVNIYHRDKKPSGQIKKSCLTSVFQLIGSTNPLMTSAISSAPTFARPTTIGSRFIQVSQFAHCWTRAGMGLVEHKLFLCCVAHMLISWMTSIYNEERRTGKSIDKLALPIFRYPMFYISLNSDDELHKEI